jgi:hypothetical protein
MVALNANQKAAETKRQFERDVAMMKTPSEWPRWPLLPLRSRTLSLADPNALAFLVSDGKPRAYIGIIFMLPPVNDQTWEQWLKPMECRDFPSFEELATEYRVD